MLLSVEQLLYNKKTNLNKFAKIGLYGKIMDKGREIMQTETYELEGQIFEWDREKNLSNIRKHGITFKIAAKAFLDPYAETYEDEKHSHDEERFLLIGMDEREKILTVCHCFRDKDNIIRIISARLASKTEQEIYEEAFNS